MIATSARIADDLRKLGVKYTDIVCAHVSMKSLGLVIGGQRAVVEGMIKAVGTLMMPTYSGDMSDPAEWQNPSVTEIDECREALPAYDPLLTPTRGMGVVAEYFRTYPGTIRSAHPQSSFSAWGSYAQDLTANHKLSDRFGRHSPLAKLVELEGKVLLLGAPWDTVSLFHLVTSKKSKADRIVKRSPVGRGWVRYSDIPYPADWFVAGVSRLIETGIATQGKVCAAESVLFPAREAFEFLTGDR